MIRGLKVALKWLAKEAVIPAMQHAVPAGAGELAQALMTQGNGFVPYGATERPMELHKNDAHTHCCHKGKEIDRD